MFRFLLALVLIITLPISGFAATLTASFTFPPEANALITGFRLMRDGVVDTDNVPATSRSFSFPGQVDNKDHSYTLIAVYKDGRLAESTPYLYKYVPPPVVKPTYFKVGVQK